MHSSRLSYAFCAFTRRLRPSLFLRATYTNKNHPVAAAAAVVVVVLAAVVVVVAAAVVVVVLAAVVVVVLAAAHISSRESKHILFLPTLCAFTPRLRLRAFV